MLYIQTYGSGRRPQGASTITQQVAKNFLLTNEVSFERKIKEALLALRIERTYSKDKILELYLNVIEWGPGIYGAESVCRYYNESARTIGRQPSARLAAILPAPLRRRPERMNNYSEIILKRMSQMGW